MGDWVLAVAAIAGAIVLGVLVARAVRGRARLGSEGDMATYRTLHLASLAAPPLRGGLTPASAQRAAKHLRTLLGVEALAITDRVEVLAWDGVGERNAQAALAHAALALESGAVVVLTADQAREVSEIMRSGVAAPLTSDDLVIGALVAYSAQPAGPAMVRAVQEVAVFASGQLDLAELDRTRARSAEAEVRVLRAQISPHFVYNSLTAIASFVRTDPDRARDLLLDFADFTRYSFRSHGRFTTLAEELHSIEQYLLLEQARFGDRLTGRAAGGPRGRRRADPVPVHPAPGGERRAPRLREHRPTGDDHDHRPRPRRGLPDQRRGRRRRASTRPWSAAASRVSPATTSGLANVDERLRSTFGDDRGLVVETAPGAGTRITMRIPKYAEAVAVDE